MTGLFITFEGVDGCGKSTQMRMLAEHLTEKGYDCLLTREPGGCKIAEDIRPILLDPANKNMHDKTEALLYAAARMQHIEEVILPALAKDKIILCDRYIDSNIAYQAYGRKLGKDYILSINEHAINHAMPDATLLFMVPPKNAFGRMSEAKEMDRLEQENMAFFERVYKGYEQTALEEPQRIIKINASGTKFETQDIVRQTIDALLAGKN